MSRFKMFVILTLFCPAQIVTRALCIFHACATNTLLIDAIFFTDAKHFWLDSTTTNNVLSAYAFNVRCYTTAKHCV
uniref:Secreted protein n=1 Tax=Lepeophtheirus salmonis TaxID=72036 RepID=A0A0K2TAF9_LEPSM